MEPELISRKAAITAIRRCAFTIPADLDGAGRGIVHSFAGGGGFALGCDMDVLDATKSVRECIETDGVPQVAWVDTMFGRCLAILRQNGHQLYFDTVTPPEQCKCPAYSPEFEDQSYHDVDAHADDCTYPPPCGGCWGCLAQQARYYEQRT